MVRLTLAAVLAAVALAASGLVAGTAVAAPPPGFSGTPLPVAGRATTGKEPSGTRSRAVAPAAATGRGGVPDVAPGQSPAGYLPLDQFGIASTPIGDEEFVTITTPQYVFAGRTYTSVSISSNGFIVAGPATAADQNCCSIPAGPNPAPPNNMIAPFWTDLDGTGAPGVYAGTLTDGVNSWIVVEHRVNLFGTTSRRVFETWIGVNGTEDISMVYDPGDLPGAPGAQQFLVGAENAAGEGDMTATLPTQDLRVTSSPLITAASVQAVSGGGQSAVAGQAFANPLVASVTGTDGQPFPDAPVTFTVTAGSASFAGSATATATTGADGRATAPTLTAGTTAGPVTVTATTPGATQGATFALTVTPAGPPTADLSATLTAPATARPNSSFTVTLTVRNAGPSAATSVASGITLPAGTRVTGAGGGAASRDGRAVGFIRPTLAAGATVTYTITVATDGSTGGRVINAGTVSPVRDPGLVNNAARTTVTVRR